MSTVRTGFDPTAARGSPSANGVGLARPPHVSVGGALRKAARGFYEQSWRLFILNTLFSAVALAILVLALYAPVALVLLVALGPLAASLMHCAVTVAQTQELRLVDALSGLRLHWRRGLVLGVATGVFVVATVVSFGFYAGSGTLGWPLAVVVLYVSGVFGVFQLVLWPLAVFQRERPLRAVFRDALLVAARRPASSVGIAVALLIVNLLALGAAVLPFLTMSIAYSFLAAAHFALPPSPTPED